MCVCDVVLWLCDTSRVLDHDPANSECAWLCALGFSVTLAAAVAADAADDDDDAGRSFSKREVYEKCVVPLACRLGARRPHRDIVTSCSIMRSLPKGAKDDVDELDYQS